MPRLDAIDRMMLDRWLVHRVELHRRKEKTVGGELIDETDVEGESVFRDPVERRCFIQDNRRRFASSEEEQFVPDWQVYFDPEEDVGEGDRLTNGKDEDGNLLLEEAVIASGPDLVRHPQRGGLVSRTLCTEH